MTRHYKMHGSTPKGRSRYYTYYVTTRDIEGVHKSVPTGVVKEQVVELRYDGAHLVAARARR